MTKSTTFFEALQKDEELDLRDNRGKRHQLSLVLLEFVLGLLCHRDGNLSSIWRHMKSHHTELVGELGLGGSVQKKRCPDPICRTFWAKWTGGRSAA